MTTPEPTGEAVWAEEPVAEQAERLSAEAVDAAADDEPITNMGQVRKLRAEAARLRHLLREEQANRKSAEEARVGDLARLSALEKRAVEREVAELLADPSDLWLHTNEDQQQGWFDQQFGEIIPDAVRDAARALVESRPHLARRATPPPSNRPVEGLRSGARPEDPAPPASWYGAIHGA